MIRLAYFFYRIISSARYRWSRRLTPAGWLMFAGLLWTGAIGVDLDQSVASQTFGLLFCLLLAAILAAPFFRGRFLIERRLPRFGSVGHPLLFSVVVANPGPKPWRDIELLEDLADPRPALSEFAELHRPNRSHRSFQLARPPRSWDARVSGQKPVGLPLVPAHGRAEAQVQWMPLRRGPLRFLGTTVARRDPLGLFRGYVRVPLRQTVLILPRRYPLPPLALPGAQQYQPGGVALAASVGESEEFVSLRDYRPGDPVRHVHWRSAARAGRLVVKEFQDEYIVRHALILDTFAELDQFDAFEEAVSVAASFSCTVETQESLLDLMFVGPQAVCCTAGRGLADSSRALEILASVHPCRGRRFKDLEALVLQHAGAVSGCVCIFLQWDAPRRELARRLTSLGLPLLVLVVTEKGMKNRIRVQPGDEVVPQVLEVGRIEEGLQRLPRTLS